MEESAIKAMRDAHPHKPYVPIKDRIISDITVEGFDTSLQKYALELAFIKHFGSCGNILSVRFVNSFAYIRFEGKGAQDKALQLDGTDVGGWTAIVKPAVRPLQSSFSCARIAEEFKLFVSGHDTCPPEIDIKIALRNHLSSCGVVTDISLLPSGRAIITIGGEGCVEKALELSGRQVGEMNLLVNTGKRTTEIRKSRRLINDNACGYVLGTCSREVAKRRKEEIAKDKKKEREMKMKEKEKKEKEKKEKKEKKKALF
ncbi:Nucleolin 1 [Cardamine amara subsp. amara]|uniref:Nucleolin 1 n=1 Tax=Cardamine amara subsp. amara TaxID=228776 RepID=A0ABD0ZPK3_CARAN